MPRKPTPSKTAPGETSRSARATAALQRLRNVAHLVDRPTVRAGEPLCDIFNDRLWRELGHARFQAFCEKERIPPERARVLRDVFGTFFQDCGLSLEKWGDTDPELLYRVRKAVTRKTAPAIARDAQRVMAGKLSATDFNLRWARPDNQDDKPPSSPHLDALTEENEWAGPASRRTRAEEATLWVQTFEDSEVDEFVRHLVKVRRRPLYQGGRTSQPLRDPRVFPPERIVTLLRHQSLSHGEWAQVLAGIARLDAFRLAFKQAQLAELVAEVAKRLTPQGRAELIERLRRMG